jgi:hypothetical protein
MKTINWYTAPPVPVDVLQRRAAGKPLGGTIVEGPLGQTTFIPDGKSSAHPPQMGMSMEPGMGLYGDVGLHFGHNT